MLTQPGNFALKLAKQLPIQCNLVNVLLVLGVESLQCCQNRNQRIVFQHGLRFAEHGATAQ